MRRQRVRRGQTHEQNAVRYATCLLEADVDGVPTRCSRGGSDTSQHVTFVPQSPDVMCSDVSRGFVMSRLRVSPRMIAVCGWPCQT